MTPVDASGAAPRSNGRRPAVGSVALVGAGPGDPDLLTLRALRALEGADVILHDALVSDAVLALAPACARRIGVGKRGDRASWRQAEIDALMVSLALSGERVVRLKAGDPMLFGRAAEELAALRAAGVPVEIVPGVTAAQAMAAAAQAPLTDRDCAHSVTFVTGRSQRGGPCEHIDIAAAARGEATLIVYMGARTAAQTRDALLAAGADPGLPCLVMSAISRPEEQRWTGPLADLVEGVATLPAEAPVLIGVGRSLAARVDTPAIWRAAAE